MVEVDLEEPKNALARQTDEIISEDTTWIDLASELDVSLYASREGIADSSSKKDFRPVFLAYLWATVEDDSLSGIPHRLEEKPDLARAFGFDPDDLPSEATFRPVRIEDRFSELETAVTSAAEHIRTIAAERGSPIGYDLARIQAGTDDSDDPPSERTINRMLRRKSKDVLDEIKQVAIPSIDLPRPEEPVYDKEELLVLEAIAAITRSAANGAGEEMGDMKNPEPEYDDPLNEDGPSGETLLEAMKEMSVDEIATVMNFTLRKLYTRAKPRLQELEHDDGSRFGTQAKVALDITYVAYRGDRDEMDWLQGAPDDKEYSWCHKFATAVIVGENTHYVVGVCPLGSTEYADTTAHPGQNNSYYIGDVARRLLSIASRYVNIRMVYADREFHAADVVHTLEARGLKYIIPAVENDRIRRRCNNFDQLKLGYEDEDGDAALYVEPGYAFHGSVKHKVTNERVTTRLVILPPDEDDPTRNDNEPQPFITNLDLGDETALDRRWARKQIEQYQDRGAIERSYASIKECAAWTTSKEFDVRWFHFAFGCIVYNMWLLVDFLTQERINVIETRKKPRIRLSRFLRKIERELMTLL